MFDNEMNDCKTKPNASLQLSMNAAMEAISVMWMRIVLTLVALTTAPVRQVTLGMENRAKVHVETFIKKIERLDFDVEVLGFVPSFTGKKTNFNETFRLGFPML